MIPEQIRAIRKARGLTQAQAAGEIGVTQATWSRWEALPDSVMARAPTGLARAALARWMR